MMTYTTLFLIVLFARAIDLLSTLLVTPDLRCEANQIFKRIGWRWSITANISLCFLAATSPDAVTVISVASILMALTNFFGRFGTRYWVVIFAMSFIWVVSHPVAIGVVLFGIMQLQCDFKK